MDQFTLPVRIDTFISIIKNKPAVWSNAKNKFGRQEGWIQIMHELYPDYSTWKSRRRFEMSRKVIKKWTQVRDSFVKSERRKSYLTDTQRDRYRSYVYSEHLQFLLPIINARKKSKKINNIDTTESEDEEPEEQEIEADSVQESIPQIKIEYSPEELEHVTIPNKRSYSNSNSSDEGPNVKVRVTEPSTSTLTDSAETHMSFFKGIIPSLESFNVDQVLQFQMGVLKLVQQIRNQV